MKTLLLLSLMFAGSARAGGLPSAATSAASSQISSEPEILVVGSRKSGPPAAVSPIELTIVVPPGFHVYKDMVAVQTLEAGGLSLGEASLPAGLMTADPALPGNTREQYDFDVIIEVPLTTPPPPGAHEARFSVRYQACKDSLCLFPKTVEVDAGVEVAAE